MIKAAEEVEVPSGMTEAAREGLGHASGLVDPICMQMILAAALRWQQDHPMVPTDEWIAERLKVYGDPWGCTTTAWKAVMEEWGRTMYRKPAPSPITVTVPCDGVYSIAKDGSAVAVIRKDDGWDEEIPQVFEVKQSQCDTNMRFEEKHSSPAQHAEKPQPWQSNSRLAEQMAQKEWTRTEPQVDRVDYYRKTLSGYVKMDGPEDVVERQSIRQTSAFIGALRKEQEPAFSEANPATASDMTSKDRLALELLTYGRGNCFSFENMRAIAEDAYRMGKQASTFPTERTA